MHALILGDHRLLADLLSRDLYGIGFETVEVAADEEHALLAGERRRPDLILVDDRNSTGVGLEVVGELSRVQLIPVVYVTGSPRVVRRRLPDAVTVSTFGAASLRAAIFKARLQTKNCQSNISDLSSYR